MATPALLPESAATTTAPAATTSRLWIQFALLLLTFFTTTAVGMRYMDNFQRGRFPLFSDDDVFPFHWVFTHLTHFAQGLPFSLTLLAILLTHEFGHYFACRHYGIRATLPYLLPAPSLSGTAGALIRLKSPVRSHAALLSIGALGPLAGFVVAGASTVIGMKLSIAVPIEPHKLVELQSPLLFKLFSALLRAHTPIHPGSHAIWHPVLLAAWIGLLITSLNLTPAGQLDGGHILYALSPRIHRILTLTTILAITLLGIFCWAGWLVWAVLLILPGMRHPKVPDNRPIPRYLLALPPLSLLILILTASAQPFTGASLLNMLHGLGQ
jgi:Zn-dependent protease